MEYCRPGDESKYKKQHPNPAVAGFLIIIKTTVNHCINNKLNIQYKMSPGVPVMGCDYLCHSVGIFSYGALFALFLYYDEK